MAWALAQAPTTARDSTGSNFPPLAYASSVTAGNLLVVVLAQYVGNPAITGSLNGAFTQGPNLNVGTSQLITTWYKVATTSGTETINFGGDTYNCAVAMLEFSGNSATPFDQQGTANSKTVTASASNAAAGDLVIAASGGNQFFNNYGFIADPAYTTLYTQNDSYPYAGLIVAYKTESGTGPSTSTISTDAGTADSNVNSVILTFKAAASGGTGIAPGAASVAFTGQVPVVARTANQALTPAQKAIAFTGFAPTLSQTSGVVAGVASVTLTGQIPTVAQSANQSLAPGVDSVALTGFVPVVARTANQALQAGVGALTFTGYVPAVTVASASVSLFPAADAVAITGYAPGVTQTGNGGIDSWGSVYVRKKKKTEPEEPIPVAGPTVRDLIEGAMEVHEPKTSFIAFETDDEDEEEVLMLLM